MSFSGTLTGGIQDISALLPLLGTEQCEKHIGSALDRGFLYSSITPISIFGSLGIVRAAFNILVAGLNIQRFRFLGARKLSDGGFTPNGAVAPMIALDPKNPKRFLAETRLEAMLAEEHIENVENLTVSWGKGVLSWNLLLIAFTLAISSTGLVPYIRIILDSRHISLNAPFPTGFGFPILRVVGSGLCVTFAQFLIQIRLMVLLKTRLLFITIDRLAKRAGIELETEINPTMGYQKANSAWNSEVASEMCMWALQTWLDDNPNAEWDPERNSEILKNRQFIKETYASEYQRQMGSIDTRMPRWVNHLLVFGLLLGCLSTIVGYVGCFYLIQHSISSNGPLLWLVLEAVLSIIRILVWAINPSWDDSTGIVFELQLASHAPLITCNKPQGDIEHNRVAPLTRSNRFLEEVVAYTGPFPAFTVNDVALYYILTAEGGTGLTDDRKPPNGILYIILSDYKEQTSRIVYKQGPKLDKFSIYLSSLDPVPRSTAINVKVDFSKEETESSHFLTSDTSFMAQLGAHYDEINHRIQARASNKAPTASFGKTWAMQRLSEDKNASRAGRLVTNLTKEDMAYLRQGQVERRWHDMYLRLEQWIELLMTLYTKELIEDVPTDLGFKKGESVTIMQKYEADEVEFLLIECQSILELHLVSTGEKWLIDVTEAHNKMVRTVTEGTFKLEQGASVASVTSVVSTASQQHSEGVRMEKMMTRLENERESLLEKEHQMRRDNRQKRLTAQMELTAQRIQERKYTNAVAETPIMKAWEALQHALSSETRETGLGVKSASHSDPVVALGAVRSRPASIKQDSRLPPSSGSSQHAHRTDAKEGMVESNGASIIKTMASRRAEFEASMCARSEAAKTEANSCKDSIERSKQLVGVTRAEARCRQRADQLFSRLDAQADEFEDLRTNSVLTADTTLFVSYWSEESLQERRRLQDRTQKYLRLTDASIKAVGGAQNMLRALQRSQEFSFIDIHGSNLLNGEEIASVVQSVKSVAGVSSSQDGQKIYKAVMANMRAAVEGQSRDRCVYANVVVTDHYRMGKPYLLFAIPGASFCDVYFYTQTKCDHTITLRHCVTKNNTKVNIMLNGHKLQESWGQAQAVQFNHNFINEDIPLPNDYLRDVGQPNVLEIILDDDSHAVYWLSDVFLPVHPVQAVVASDTTIT